MNQSLLKELVSYNQETGVFTWNSRPRKHFETDRDHKIWNSKHSGSEILNPDKKGYLYLNLKGKRYPLHALAWLYAHGVYKSMLDHKNGIVSDNRLVNLRPSTHKQNVRNQKLKRSNTSGFKGVSFSKQKGKWRSQIRTDSGRVHLGFFSSKVKAAKAYDNAAVKFHGEFALTNKMMGLYDEQ